MCLSPGISLVLRVKVVRDFVTLLSVPSLEVQNYKCKRAIRLLPCAPKVMNCDLCGLANLVSVSIYICESGQSRVNIKELGSLDFSGSWLGLKKRSSGFI